MWGGLLCDFFLALCFFWGAALVGMLPMWQLCGRWFNAFLCCSELDFRLRVIDWLKLLLIDAVRLLQDERAANTAEAQLLLIIDRVQGAILKLAANYMMSGVSAGCCLLNVVIKVTYLIFCQPELACLARFCVWILESRSQLENMCM